MSCRRRSNNGGRFPVLAVIGLCLSFVAAACRGSSVRTYELKGQVLSVDQARQELTIKHEDIPGFMPAMTMAYKVRDSAMLKPRQPGELITATLVVEEPAPYLRSIQRTGVAALPEDLPPPTRVMNVLSEGQPVRDAELVDQDGARRTLKDWHGQVLAVTFVYTRCPLPNFCPLVERHFAEVQEQVRAAADLHGRVRLLSVTLDPEYDTPDVLARHGQRLKQDRAIWSLLTGSRPQVEAFAEQFGVSAVRDNTQPSELLHNLRTAVIDGNGTLVTVLSGAEWQPSQLLAEIRRARARS